MRFIAPNSCGYVGYDCVGIADTVDVLTPQFDLALTFKDTDIVINDYYTVPKHIRGADPNIVALDDMVIDPDANPDFPEGRLDDCDYGEAEMLRQNLWENYTAGMKPIVAGSVLKGAAYTIDDLVVPEGLTFDDTQEMVPGLAGVIPIENVFGDDVDAPDVDVDDLLSDALNRWRTAQLRAYRHVEGFDIPMRSTRTWEILHQANSLNLAMDKCERFVISHDPNSGAHSSIEYTKYQKTRQHRLEGQTPLYNVSGGQVVVDGVPYTVPAKTGIDGTAGFAVFLDLDTSKPSLKGSVGWGQPSLKVIVPGAPGNPSIGPNALYIGEVSVVYTRTMRNSVEQRTELPNDKGVINYCIMRNINQVCIPYDINTGTLQKAFEQVFEQDVTGLVWYDSTTRKFKIVQCSPSGNGVLYMYGNSYIDKLTTRTCDE